MKKKFCRGFLALTFTLLCLKIPAQQALKIGETLPETFWTTPLQVVNHSEKTITLDKDRGKLILLDFWNTWCGACLKGFPKMEALQKEFGDQVKILAVTSQDRPTLEKFFAAKNGQRFAGMPSVTQDKMLKQLFPHVAVPFIVWIRDGKMLSTTDAMQVTAAKIGEIVQGKGSSLETVLQIGRDRPLMLAEQFDLEKGTTLMNYVLFSKGRIRAIAPGSGFHRQGDVVRGRQLTNMSLQRIYEGIAYEIFGAQGQHFSAKRLVNMLKNPSAISVQHTEPPGAAGEKLYSFEFIVPVAQAGTLYQQMLTSLNAYSGYTGTIETKSQKCLVVHKISGTAQGAANHRKKETGVSGQPLPDLIADLNDLPGSLPLIIDESGFTGTIAADAKTAGTLDALKRVLLSAGLGVTETERDLLMLVLKDGGRGNL